MTSRKRSVADLESVRELLYQCIVELEYVQSVENCNSGLCKSAKGRDLIEQGMKLLGVADLSAELLPKGKRKVRVVFRNEQYLCFPGVDNLAEKLDKLAAFAAKQQRTKGK